MFLPTYQMMSCVSGWLSLIAAATPPEVAGVEGNSDGIFCGRINAGVGGVSLGDADHLAGPADRKAQAGDAPALQESLGTARADELQAVQRDANRRLEASGGQTAAGCGV